MSILYGNKCRNKIRPSPFDWVMVGRAEKRKGGKVQGPLVQGPHDKIEKDTITCSAAMRACEKGEVLLTEALEDTITCSAAMSACEKGGVLTEALTPLSSMANDKIEKDTITCSAAMSACEKGGVLTEALTPLSSMASDKIEKDTVTCSAAMSACEKRVRGQKENAKPKPNAKLKTKPKKPRPKTRTGCCWQDSQRQGEPQDDNLLAGLGLDEFWEIFQD